MWGKSRRVPLEDGAVARPESNMLFMVSTAMCKVIRR